MWKCISGICLLLLLAFNVSAETERELFKKLCEYKLCKTSSYHGGIFKGKYVGAETLYSLMEMDRPGKLDHGMDRLVMFNEYLPGKQLIQIAIVTDNKQCKEVEDEFDKLMATGKYPSMCFMTFPVECK